MIVDWSMQLSERKCLSLLFSRRYPGNVCVCNMEVYYVTWECKGQGSLPR